MHLTSSCHQESADTYWTCIQRIHPLVVGRAADGRLDMVLNVGVSAPGNVVLISCRVTNQLAYEIVHWPELR